MVIDRRQLLKSSAALASCAVWSAAGLASSKSEGQLFLTAARRGTGQCALLVLDETARIVREIPLIDRGHDAIVHRPSRMCVAFARRPGNFAVAFDIDDAREPAVFTTPPDRHFYGHGAFSPDGRFVYATENDFENASGIIGIYEVSSGFVRVGEFPTHGIGPHDVLLTPDGKTLVVANGGIETHPETGRAKLNVSNMRPSLVFLDRRDGALLARQELPGSIHKLSIRHLDMDAAGTVWFGCQWEGALDSVPSLIGSTSLDTPITLLDAIEGSTAGLRGYIGSLAISGDGRVLAASAPRAGRIVYIDTLNGRQVGETLLTDGCGIAPFDRHDFAISSGEGQFVVAPDHMPRALHVHPRLSFDNHITRF